MDGIVSEKEQIEALRAWWSENGLWVVAGVVLAIVGIIGWKWWQNEQERIAGEASALYESLVQEVADLEVEPAEEKAARLAAEYDGTVYAAQARLAIAKLYMDLGRDQDAAEELRALVAAGDAEDTLRMVGRLRLARILLYQEKAEEAIELLQGYGHTAFAARYAEALGDAYAALGRTAEARQAYTAALAENPQARTVDATLVHMKINDLPRSEPGAPAATATEGGAGAADASPAGSGGAAAGEADGSAAGEKPAEAPPEADE